MIEVPGLLSKLHLDTNPYMDSLGKAGQGAESFSQKAAGFFGSASKAAFGMAVVGVGAIGSGLAMAGKEAFDFSSSVTTATKKDRNPTRTIGRTSTSVWRNHKGCVGQQFRGIH